MDPASPGSEVTGLLMGSTWPEKGLHQVSWRLRCGDPSPLGSPAAAPASCRPPGGLSVAPLGRGVGPSPALHHRQGRAQAPEQMRLPHCPKVLLSLRLPDSAPSQRQGAAAWLK